jgi:hypothetical protein
MGLDKYFVRLVAVVFALTVTVARAATLLVSNTNDGGVGSLRDAIISNNAAGGGDMIVFSNVVTGTITLTTGDLLVMSNVTILGPGPGTLAINGNAANRVFHITNGATVAISGLTITNGAVTGAFPGHPGGGIWNDHSTLTLSNCAISGNNGGGSSGGVYSDGSLGTAALSVIACTLANNLATNSGGAISTYSYEGSSTLVIIASTFVSNTAAGNGNVGGAVFNDGNNGAASMSISNSTFFGNTANLEGGAIYHGGAAGLGISALTVTDCTFGSNTAEGGGAIFDNGASSTLTIGDTILKAGSSGGTIVNNGGFFTSTGYNLCSDGGNGLFNQATDQNNTDALLGPLANNGGPTFTEALLPGSPAIDKGKSFGLTTDQRGSPRPFDVASIANASGGDGSDIGAFELGRPPLGIQKIGSNVLLSWPWFYTNYALQSSTSVVSSNSWATASGSAAVTNGLYQQTNGPISSNRFFRLRGN